MTCAGVAHGRCHVGAVGSATRRAIVVASGAAADCAHRLVSGEETLVRADAVVTATCVQAATAEPAQRPNAYDLLQHPFLKKASNGEFITQLLRLQRSQRPP
eukprot:gene55838-44417_t